MNTTSIIAETTSFESDERLVQHCLEGDERAWSELIDKYKNLIYSIPVKRGLSTEEARDIFQSVCLELLKSLGRLRERRALAAWLIRVTYSKCYHTRRNREDTSHDLSRLPSGGPGPDELYRQVEREQAFREATSELSERCQKLVQMLFFESPPRPYAEVAESLGLATGSVGFIRGRCLDRLRRELQKKGVV